ncbi:MAG: hypothetical protein AB8B68_03790 [Rickettsiaceae bacterium]
MKSYLSIFLLLVFLTVSCSKKESIEEPIDEETTEEEEVIEEPKNEVYFTIKTGCNLVLGSFDFWVILHQENGELIEFKPFNYLINETIEFKALEDKKPDNFTVTIFSVSSERDDSGYSLFTTTQFKKGETLDYSCEGVNSSAITGTFNLTVNNIPNVNGMVTGFSAWNGESSGILTPGRAIEGNLISYFGDLDILESKRDYIISIQDGFQNSKHYVLSNYNAGDNINLNYADFYNYENYLNIDYPRNFGLSFNLKGLSSEQNETYTLNKIFSGPSSEGVLKAGQLSRFDSYNIQFNIKPSLKYEYRYRKNGQLPTNIVIPEQPLMSIEDASIKEFKFDINLSDYLNKTSSWSSFNDGAISTWMIQSKENYSPIIGDLPEELLIKYPNLNFENLRYTQTTFKLNEEETIILLNPN